MLTKMFIATAAAVIFGLSTSSAPVAARQSHQAAKQVGACLGFGCNLRQYYFYISQL
jgi:hypothetical protein